MHGQQNIKFYTKSSPVDGEPPTPTPLSEFCLIRTLIMVAGLGGFY
jgi:hypothetical protein